MQIELTDREYWLTVVAERLQKIQEGRDARDREFEANWRKRWLLPDRKPDEFPNVDELCFSELCVYPSIYMLTRTSIILRISAERYFRLIPELSM